MLNNKFVKYELRNWLAICDVSLRTSGTASLECQRSSKNVDYAISHECEKLDFSNKLKILNGEINACDFQCRMFLLYLYSYLIVIYVSFHGTSMSPILMAPHDYLVTFYLLPCNAKIANLIIKLCIVYWILCSMLFSERHLQYSVRWYDSRGEFASLWSEEKFLFKILRMKSEWNLLVSIFLEHSFSLIIYKKML